MRLRVSIGSRKDDLQTAWVNVDEKPTEIDTEYWIGRVLVRVKDFDGFTPDGSAPTGHSEYFEGRNRRFHIQAEGRFKKRYNGDQVWFGTQFDHMIGNFPETLFNAGMRIAKYIDPAVFYDKNSATPYIMSPYLACVNTLSAWPAPHRSQDAVLALENGHAQTESDDEHDEDEMPREVAQHDKKSSPAKPIRYWSFQGFREDDRQNEQNKASGTSVDGTPREGSIRSQATKYDEERMVTVENPNHRLALTRLGSYGRNPDTRRLSVIAAEPSLGNFPESLSEAEEGDSEEDDDNDSFYTAAEYIFENEVQPDGSVKPVKKAKKGLTVKKVRKSLHIPSAKTVQKNMRGLSIKRKEKGSRRTDSMGTEATNESSRHSGEVPPTRKSLDLMRPFRFGHHDKDQQPTSRRSMQVDRPTPDKNSQFPKSRQSMSDERDLYVRSSTASVPRQNASISASARSGGPRSSSPRPFEPAVLDTRHSTEPPPSTIARGKIDLATAPPIRLAADGSFLPVQTEKQSNAQYTSTRSESMVTTSAVETQTTGMHSQRKDARQVNSENSVDRATSTPHRPLASETSGEQDATSAPTAAVRNPFKTTGVTEIRGDTLDASSRSDDGLSHRFDNELGPWRFSNAKVEPIEDTAFIFGDTSHSVKDRRKHFAKSAETRREFDFDPDIVYCMSFFLPYMNFNTFDLKLGPLGANLHKYVNDQPVRYMARSADRPDEVFFMVEFNLE